MAVIEGLQIILFIAVGLFLLWIVLSPVEAFIAILSPFQKMIDSRIIRKYLKEQDYTLMEFSGEIPEGYKNCSWYKTRIDDWRNWRFFHVKLSKEGKPLEGVFGMVKKETSYLAYRYELFVPEMSKGD